MEKIIKNAKIFDGNKWINPGHILIGENGIIKDVSKEPISKEGIPQIDLLNNILTAGFIDIHVHGGFGIYFVLSDNFETNIKEYSKKIAQKGVTNFLTSLTALNHNELLETLEICDSLFSQVMPGANFSGVHLEGPYINPLKKGAFNPASLRDIDLEEGRRILSKDYEFIRQITISPELPLADDMAKLFIDHGVKVAAGHSIADYDLAKQAFENNFKHATHTYNAMSGLNHREPGLVGAILTNGDVTAELICDLFHVAPAPIKILHKCKGAEHIAIITDAMSAAGLPDGEYDYGHGAVRIVQGGKSLLPDGTIAGSTVTMDKCVQNLVNVVKLPVEDVLVMASKTPAQVIGIDNEVGTIEKGKKANFVVLNEKLEVQKTFIDGKIIN